MSRIHKRLGEDWQFFFKLQNEDDSFVNLNGYQYSIIVADQEEDTVYSASGPISVDGQELAITCAASLTADFKAGEFAVEFLLTDPNGVKVLSDKAVFFGEDSLHANVE